MLTCDYFDLCQLSTLRMWVIEHWITPKNTKPNKNNNLQKHVIKVLFYNSKDLTIINVIIRIKTNQK